MIMANIRVGVIQAIEPDVFACARSLTTWQPPLPRHCRLLGRYVHVFALLAQYAHLNYTIVPLPGHVYGEPILEESGDTIDFNSTMDVTDPMDFNTTVDKTMYNFTGHIGALQRGEVDIIVGSMTYLTSRSRQFTYLRPIKHLNSAVLVSYTKPVTFAHEFKSLMMPLDVSMWMAFIALFFVIRILSAFARQMVGEHSKIVTVVSIIITLHLLNIYKGTLVSSYLIKRPRSTLNTFDDVIDAVESGSTKLILSSRLTLTLPFVERDNDKRVARLRAALSTNPIVFHSDDPAYAERLINRTEGLLLSIDDNSHYEQLKRSCNMRQIPLNIETEYNSYNSFMLRRESTELARVLNEAMAAINIDMHMPRIEDVYFRDILHRREMCRYRYLHLQGSFRSVGLANISGPIMLMATLAMVAVALLIGETIAERIIRSVKGESAERDSQTKFIHHETTTTPPNLEISRE